MEFVETSIFTRQIMDLLTDAEYRRLQHELLVNPVAGSVITRGGGLRKIRWGTEGKGKRGGIRVIYYYLAADARVLCLYAYAKGRQDDLTDSQVRMLRSVVQEELSWKKKCLKS